MRIFKNENIKIALKRINSSFKRLLDSYFLFHEIFQKLALRVHIYDPKFSKQLNFFLYYETRNLEMILNTLDSTFLNLEEKTIR